MPPSSTPPIAEMRLHTALRAVAGSRAPFGAGLAALILALLARLLVRTEAAWDLIPHGAYEYEGWDAAGPQANPIPMPAIGRAPHAAVVEGGLVPDWILSGVRKRGMRRAAPPMRPHLRPRPARAPPLP